MKANELMIDDWVYRPDCYDQVKEISNNGIIGLDSLRGRIMFGELKSIPLTAEILEKNGFKNPTLNDPELINYVFKASFEYKFPLPNVEVLRVNYYDGVEWDFYALLGERKSSDCGEQYEYVIIIKYVHELQHALHLCRIDKEITI